MNFEVLSRKAVRAALDLRRSSGLGLTNRVCPFEIAESLGISVRLLPAPTLEGMYSPGSPPMIVVGSARPHGRMRYSAAHELGHHVFGHGERIDELLADEEQDVFDPAEYAADRFAAALLMPKLAVEAAFNRRAWSIVAPSPEQVFVVSSSLGVGYETLVGYLERTLRLVDAECALALRRARPKQLRRQIAGFEVEHDLYLVDEHSNELTVDGLIGDVFIPSALDVEVVGPVELRKRPRTHVLALAPGIASIVSGTGDWRSTARIGRREFDGIARYRYLEAVDDV